MRRSPKLIFASAAVVVIAGLTTGCGSSSKTTTAAAVPSAAASTMAGSRSWSATITDGSHSFAAMFTLGPAQKLSAYPGGFASLRCRRAASPSPVCTSAAAATRLSAEGSP